MLRRLFGIASTISLLLCVIFAVVYVRSWFVYDHIANAAMQRPAWVVRSFHGTLCLDHRSFWEASGGWTWDRHRLGPGDEPALYLYQQPSVAYGLLGYGFYRGTAFSWPGHLYPGVTPPVSHNDPRWWRDNFAALIVPDGLILVLLLIVPALYFRRQLRGVMWPPAEPGQPPVPGRIFTIAAAVSLLLFLWLCQLGLRSYRIGDLWYRGTADGFTQVAVGRNQLSVTFGLGNRRPRPVFPAAAGNTWTHVFFAAQATTPGGPGLLQSLGFAYQNQHPLFRKFRSVVLPLWPLWLLSAVLPVRWIFRRRREQLARRRRQLSQCAACGYLLTGNTSGVCPECGTAWAKV